MSHEFNIPSGRASRAGSVSGRPEAVDDVGSAGVPSQPRPSAPRAQGDLPSPRVSQFTAGPADASRRRAPLPLPPTSFPPRPTVHSYHGSESGDSVGEGFSDHDDGASNGSGASSWHRRPWGLHTSAGGSNYGDHGLDHNDLLNDDPYDGYADNDQRHHHAAPNYRQTRQENIKPNDYKDPEAMMRHYNQRKNKLVEEIGTAVRNASRPC